MIIVKISGGLGNQLFQYAFAKSLEQRRQIQVKIDTSSFQLPTKTITPRQFLINNFNISIKIADRNDFHKIKVPFPANKSVSENFYRIIFKIQEFLRPAHFKKIIIDHRLNFNQSMFETRDNCYISGGLTNQKYFIDIKKIILKEITPKFALSDKSQELMSKIRDTESVSVHVRRGDYLKYTHKFVILSEDYYHEAVRIIKEKEKKPTFFIFSDDIEYAKTNYAKIFGVETVYISGENIADHEELWLMSQCKHNIIANSTFGWWGAWLNKNPNKIVIAPKQYRNDNKNISDFFPQEWILI